MVEGRIAGVRPRPPRRPRSRPGCAAPGVPAAASPLRSHLAYPVPDAWQHGLADDTVVCRCEEVTVGTLRSAVVERDRVADARTAKLLVRPGMGWCQGRMCGYATSCLTAAWAERRTHLSTPATDPSPQPVSARAGRRRAVPDHQ